MKKRIKTTLRILLALATIGSLFLVPWPVVWAWILPLPDSVQEQVDQAIDRGFDGILVYVDQASQEPQFYAAGWHDRDKKIPADPKALFKIASISKLYHAVAITKLVHEGQLSLDLSLADAFPELVGRIEHAEKITLRHLVQHRSGIPNFTDTKDYWMDPPINNKDKLSLVLDLPANFEPGQGHEYCNTNYLLISELIEKTVKNGKFSYMQETILHPLQLKNTFESIHNIGMDDLMSGYYVGIEEDIKTADYGCMIATAEDVGIFLRALNNGSIFKEGEKEIYDSLYHYDHTGLVPGYQSIAKYHPEIDTVIVQFTNTVEFPGYTWNVSEVIYNRIVKILKKNTH